MLTVENLIVNPVKNNFPLFIFLSSSAISIITFEFFYKKIVEMNRINDELRSENNRIMDRINEFKAQNRDVFQNFNSSDIRYQPDDNTPDQYICPITREIIRQPVKIMDGVERYYERLAIQAWYNSGHRSAPMSRSPLADPRAIENDLSLRIKIADYILSRNPVDANIIENLLPQLSASPSSGVTPFWKKPVVPVVTVGALVAATFYCKLLNS